MAVGGEEGDDGRAEAAAHHAHGVDRVEAGPLAVSEPADDEFADGVEDPDERDEEGSVGALEGQVSLGVIHEIDVPGAPENTKFINFKIWLCLCITFFPLSNEPVVSSLFHAMFTTVLIWNVS